MDCDYYTDAIDYTQVKVLEEFEGEPLNGARRAHGDVRVNRQIVGFKKIKFYTMENVGAGKLNMPEQEMHTTSFWLHFPAEFLARLADFTPTEKQSGITGLGNALRTVAALLLMCDPRDLGVALSEEMAGSKLFRAQSLPLRHLPRRHRPERAALPPDCRPATQDGRTAGRLRLRGRLPLLCRPHRRKSESGANWWRKNFTRAARGS